MISRLTRHGRTVMAQIANSKRSRRTLTPAYLASSPSPRDVARSLRMAMANGRRLRRVRLFAPAIRHAEHMHRAAAIAGAAGHEQDGVA